MLYTDAIGWGADDASRPDTPGILQPALSLAVAAVSGGLMLLPPVLAVLVLLGVLG